MMVKPSNKTVAHVNRPRPGDGSPVAVSFQTMPLTNGNTVQGFSIDLSNAPVPDRNYVADVASVVHNPQGVKLVFGQVKFSGALRSLLVIHFTELTAQQFVASLTQIDNEIDKIQKLIDISNFPLLDLKQVDEPEQTVAFASNTSAIAVFGMECCLDFFNISSFSMSTAVHTRQVGVDPVVRINMHSGLLISILAELKRVSSNFKLEF